MRRREFIAGLGSAVALPLASHAQQPERMRRLGVLVPYYDDNDPETKTSASAFTRTLADLGWTDGRNVRMDLRWGRGDVNRIRALAQKLVGLKPDIIVTNTAPATVALQRETRTIETAITVLGREPGGGLVVMPSPFMNVHRAPIISAAARNNVPAVYGRSFYARDGGLLSYGPDPADIYRRAASYIDRILRGAKPGDLPVQFPVKGREPQDRQGARPDGAAIDSAECRRGNRMIKRRQFIAGLGGTVAAWPLTARSQQAAMPAVGALFAGSPEQTAARVAAFRGGLSETGYVEGRNVTIEYRWANLNLDRLPELAADLVRRRVAVLAAPDGAGAALAAKTATATIPIVFGTSSDPVQVGLVASLARPGGNLTGITNMNTDLAGKRLGLLHELLPQATRFAVLVMSSDDIAGGPRRTSEELRSAVSNIGGQIEVLAADNSGEIEAAFADLVRKRIQGLVIAPDPLFASRMVQIVTLATRHAVVAIYPTRMYAEAGGLMSYGADFTDLYRQVGIYSGRVLKGEKPGDIPILRATKFELVINLATARAFELTVPSTLLAIADAVIE
jgi:putative ABC transport system substrate-binding protein